MAIVSPGFVGRARSEDSGLPSGQYLTRDFPVLSTGPTPEVSRTDWEFSIETEDGSQHRWDWAGLESLSFEEVHTDIHCVTRWSKLGTSWRGVSLDTLFADVETSAGYALQHAVGGYTTSIAVADLLGGKAWLVTEYEGSPLAAEHGGPARLVVPHLYFWKSAKWIRSITLHTESRQGFWEQNGYHPLGDPWREQRYEYDS